jgi:GntR family histidine utilization transcriptional repressor
MPGPEPLYLRVKHFLLDRIRSGEWPPESQIPSEKELVELLGVSRMTVIRALRELSAEEYLVRVQGVGTFVAARKPRGTLLEIKSIADEIEERGGEYSNRIIVLRQEMASAELAIAMNLKARSAVFHSIIVHLENGIPVQYADRYVNPSVAPDYLKQDFSKMTPSRYLLDNAPLTEAEHIIEAILPEKEISKLLQMKASEPCLLVHRRTWAHDIVVTKSRFLYPGTRYQIGGRFKPPSGSELTVA